MKRLKHTLSNMFGSYSNKVWRAFFVSVPARLWGVITIPMVGHISGAYQVQELGPLLKAVGIYALLGFGWALFIEFKWSHIQQYFKGVKK